MGLSLRVATWRAFYRAGANAAGSRKKLKQLPCQTGPFACPPTTRSPLGAPDRTSGSRARNRDGPPAV